MNTLNQINGIPLANCLQLSDFRIQFKGLKKELN